MHSEWEIKVAFQRVREVIAMEFLKEYPGQPDLTEAMRDGWKRADHIMRCAEEQYIGWTKDEALPQPGEK